MATQLDIYYFLDTQGQEAKIQSHEPIKNLNSGIPYKGSKRKISHLILQEIRNNAPHAKYFYDMFGGGGAIALNAHYNGYTTHYNELDKDVYVYMEFIISQLQNKKGKYGILPDEWYQFVTKAEFDKIKADTTPSAYRSFVLINYSFGNDWHSYFCNAEKEAFKHKGHYLMLDNNKECAEWWDSYFKDKGGVCGVYQHLHDEIYPSLNWRERRPYFVDLTLKLEAIRVAQIAHLFQKKSNADTYKAIKDISQKDLCRLIDKHNPHLPKKNYKGTQGKGLTELKQLEQLQRLQQLEQLQRLQRLEQLEQLERLERLDLITHTNLDYAEVKITTPPHETIIYCFDKETQIFTKDGWKYLSEIDIERDMFFSRNPQTQELDFVKATHYINRHYSGKMWKHESKFIDLLVTPEHRIYSYNLKTRDKIGVFEFVEARDFDKLSNAHFVSGGAKWNGEHIDFFKICGKHFNAIDFAYLLGIFITDGSINNQNAISIHQVKPHIREKIEAVLKRLGIEYSAKEHNYYIPMKYKTFFKQFYLKRNRRIPQSIKGLNTPILRSLFQGILDGDGTIEKSGKTTISMGNNQGLIADITEIAYKLGYSVRISENKPKKSFYKKENRYIESKESCYTIRIRKLHHYRKHNSNSQWIDYNDMIYCLTLEKWHTILVKRNEKQIWCGQCDIPYQNSSEYKLCGNSFDYERFYKWCIDKAKQGYNVFISEYNMPQDRFSEIWSKETYANFAVLKSECGAKNKPSRTEKLFVPKV